MGLFDGERLQAVYLFIEVEPKVMEVHYSSRRDVSRHDVIAGGQTLVNWFLERGNCVQTWIMPRNRPVAQVALECGLMKVGSRIFLEQDRSVVLDHFLALPVNTSSSGAT